MPDENNKLVGSKAIAALFGMTTRRVQQLVAEDVITAVKEKPFRFELTQAIQQYIKYLSDKANGREVSKDGTKTEVRRMEAEADLKRTKADMASIQLKELEGKMHRSEDVEDITTDLVYTIRSALLALPGRLAVDTAPITSAAEISVIVQKEVCKILEELADYKYSPEEYARRVREREGWSEFSDDEDE